MSDMNKNDPIERLQAYVNECSKIVFFGGAGVSTESGIPDFRSVDGLYNMKYDFPPETILSHDFLLERPKDFYKFYSDKLVCPDAKPNACHKKLAEMEQKGKLLSVITQNIDGLHQAAGSRVVHELHGSVKRNYCVKCYKRYDGGLPEFSDYPRCERCGGMIRPDVVMYGEMLDDDVVSSAISDISRADMMIIAGTSLSVYPAAGLISYFRGKYLVIVNKTATSADGDCSLVIRQPVGQVFAQLKL